jgi:uncharacterized protein (TIGR02266 family)
MSAKRKILVVDDTAMFRELESVFLARFGAVITASGGEEALALARRELPAVVVTDLNMPGMQGDALCRAIRADHALRDTPVIVVTSGENASDRARAVRAGADDIVPKPISRMSLVEAVSHFLRTPRDPSQPRVTLETRVFIRGAGSESWGRSCNVSRGGIYVESDRLIPRDTEVEVRFSLPESPQLLAPTARVIWGRPPSSSRPAGMGMQFLALDGDSSRQIEDFIHTRAPQRASAAGHAA